MPLTSDNIQVTSTTPTGATLATDFVNSSHYQYVKLAVGADGGADPVSSVYPLNVVYTGAGGMPFVPVAGSTNGLTPIQVQITGGASLDVANATFIGGTIDTLVAGVSADIRTIKGGITIGIETIGSTKLVVSGDVQLQASTNNIGDVDVLTVAIPSVFTVGGKTAGTTEKQLTTDTFTSGVRVTNVGTVNTVYVGPTGLATATAFPLTPLDTLFLETSSGSGIYILTASGTTDVRYIGS